MCHESATQIAELLEGIKPTVLTKGLKMLATNQDKNFLSLEKNMLNMSNNFDNKLSEIISLIKSNKIDTDEKLENNKNDTDEKLEKLQIESTTRCEDHKKELASKFKEIDKNTEVMTFFDRHPIILNILGITFKVIAFILLFILAYSFGHENIFKTIWGSF